MKKKAETTSGRSKLHWLQIGEELLDALRHRGDSGDLPEGTFLEESAARYGKSTHTIRKIIDAATWVNAFYPHLLKAPPKAFPMTNALQLRSIHRLDPSRADAISHDVFEGTVSRRHLTEIIDELRDIYRIKAKSNVVSSVSGPNPQDGKAFEELVQRALKPLLEGSRSPFEPVISTGHGLLPPCDFLIQEDGKPTIAVAAKNLPVKGAKERILHLLGNFALWQSQGLGTWLFVPLGASSRIEELKSMAAECRLNPLEVFVVDGEGAKPWRPEIEGP